MMDDRETYYTLDCLKNKHSDVRTVKSEKGKILLLSEMRSSLEGNKDNKVEESYKEILTDFSHAAYVLLTFLDWKQNPRKLIKTVCFSDFVDSESTFEDVPVKDNIKLWKNFQCEVENLEWVLNRVTCMRILPSVLSVYKTCFNLAFSDPVLRKETLQLAQQHIQKSLKANGNEINKHTFEMIKELLIIGFTDVWSMIRILAINSFDCLLDFMRSDQIHIIYVELLQILKKKGEKWQVFDGALGALDILIHKFKKVEDIIGYKNHESSWNLEEQQLPPFITETFPAVVFTLLSHPQLYVRNRVVRAFSSFLLRSDFTVMYSSFQDVLKHLSVGRNSEKFEQMNSMNLSQSPGNVDAFMAQSLLSLAVFLIKNLPTGLILMDWPYTFRIFLLYLSHPACTVRQTASDIFKYLVIRDSTSVAILKLVLQGLAEGWIIDVAKLMRDSELSNVDKMQKFSKNVSYAWEWKEGRLLAYELILQELLNLIADIYEDQASPRTSSSSRSREYQSHLQPSRRHSVGGPKSWRVPLIARSWSEVSSFLGYRNSLIDGIPNYSLSAEDLSQLIVTQKIDFSIPLDNQLPFRKDGIVHACQSCPEPSASEDKVAVKQSLLARLERYPTHPSWLNDVNLSSLPTLFGHMLLHSVECLGNSQWELQRMGQQFLPVLTEIILLYNSAILYQFWEQYLINTSSIIGYGAYLTLHLALQQLCAAKDTKNIISLDEPVPAVIKAFPRLVEQIRKEEVDKISILSIAASISVCKLWPSLGQEIFVATIVFFFEQLFITAHPDSHLSTYNTSINIPVKCLSFKQVGVLSVVEKSRGDTAGQVERSLLLDLNTLLPEFVQQNAEDAFGLLPQLAFYLDFYKNEPDIWGIASTCLLQIANKMASVGYKLSSRQNTIIHLVVTNLARTIFTQILENFQMKQVLEIGSVFLAVSGGSSATAALLKAICSKLKNVNLNQQYSLCKKTDVQPLVGKEESHESNEAVAFRLKSEGSSSEHDSDWDSWSDEEEEADAGLVTIITKFVQSLYQQSLLPGPSVTGIKNTFDKAVQQLELEDMKIVHQICTQRF